MSPTQRKTAINSAGFLRSEGLGGGGGGRGLGELEAELNKESISFASIAICAIHFRISSGDGRHFVANKPSVMRDGEKERKTTAFLYKSQLTTAHKAGIVAAAELPSFWSTP